VAGLKAGVYCPTWPKMCGEWFPEEMIMVRASALANFTEVGAGVQFVHRTFAWVLVVFIVYIWLRSNKLNLTKWQHRGITWIVYLTTLQVMLGIFTLLYGVPVILGVLHQSVAFFLFAAFLYLIFQLRHKQTTVPS
jgi:heme a synthase